MKLQFQKTRCFIQNSISYLLFFKSLVCYLKKANANRPLSESENEHIICLRASTFCLVFFLGYFQSTHRLSFIHLFLNTIFVFHIVFKCLTLQTMFCLATDTRVCGFQYRDWAHTHTHTHGLSFVLIQRTFLMRF